LEGEEKRGLFLAPPIPAEKKESSMSFIFAEKKREKKKSGKENKEEKGRVVLSGPAPAIMHFRPPFYEEGREKREKRFLLYPHKPPLLL